MMSHIRHVTIRLAKKTKDLKAEKQKTDILLFQMLPTSVSKRLKANQIAEPEHYDAVTVYFSEILGFTALSDLCTPIQVRNVY